MQFPFSFKTVSLPEYNNNLLRAMASLKIVDTSIHSINDNELIIKVFASPVNPSDIAFLRGGYNIKKPLPASPGFEGSGTVVFAGENDKHLIGKNIAFFSQDAHFGAWAEYIKVHRDYCIVMNDKMCLEQAACFSINPLTALGLFEEIDPQNVKTIILTAAGGRVADFLRNLAEKNNINTINVVRSQAKAIELQNNLNANIHKVLTINTSDEISGLMNFKDGNEPIIAFDAVGGEFSGKLFNILPKNSKLILYGALSEGDIRGIDPIDLIFNNKQLKGFNLNHWIEDNKTSEKFEVKVEQLENLFVNKQLSTNIKKTFSLSEINLAIREYIKDMSGGKVLIRP